MGINDERRGQTPAPTSGGRGRPANDAGAGPEWLWGRVDKSAGSDECWLWTGNRGKKGYGALNFRLKTWAAHRLAWFLTNGPIDSGLLVCHRCDNPPCCNPAHLFLGTNLNNMADMRTKGRSRGQKTTHCPKGHAYDVANTRIKKSGARVCRTCHRVAQGKVQRIQRAAARERACP